MKLLTTAAAALALSLLVACNTIGGIGEDVESVGETIQDAAE